MDIAEKLANVLPRYANEQLVNYLIAQANQSDILREPIAYICGLIDLPASIEFSVAVFASNIDYRKRSSVTRWGEFSHPKLSKASTNRLQSLWDNPRNDDQIRNFAFRLWLTNSDSNELSFIEIIKQVTEKEPFYNDAIRERAWLGDKTCVENLLSLLNTDATLFRVAHKVWCSELLDVANEYLEGFRASIPDDFLGRQLDEHYYLAELLMMIPVQDADDLLVKNWAHLLYSRLFVQSALFVGTPNCLKLADDAIKLFPPNVNPLEHIDFHFGFGPLARKTPITLGHLKRLAPYMNYMDRDALATYAEATYICGDEGMKWCKVNLPEQEYVNLRRRYSPNEEDLHQLLDTLSGQGMSRYHLLNKIKDRVKPRKMIEILGHWLTVVPPTYQRVRMAADVIEEMGIRKDLALLEITMNSGIEQQMVDDIFENAKFAVYRRTLE
jgi:hypothetical protein